MYNAAKKNSCIHMLTGLQRHNAEAERYWQDLVAKYPDMEKDCRVSLFHDWEDEVFGSAAHLLS